MMLISIGYYIAIVESKIAPFNYTAILQLRQWFFTGMKWNFILNLLWYKKNPTHYGNQRLPMGTREPCYTMIVAAATIMV